ncbi:MAG: hypothetical protein OEM24_08560 [Paracoccaceae bacterium]|nr:hypothetical protein [Paracoccaceae bacterium]
MADAPTKTLIFEAGCGDCGRRRVDLPAPLPAIDDDFDWLVRDYDSFRLFMMEELAYRFPERRRWTPADVEVLIVEALAAALDRLSHTLDLVQNEHFLATARRPGSVRRLLALIGYDAPARQAEEIAAELPSLPTGSGPETPEAALERYWRLFPQAMETARAEGPRLIAEQKRMVTLADHAERLAGHPLCDRAAARLVWTGAWSTILVSLLLDAARKLDDPLTGPRAGPLAVDDTLWDQVQAYHAAAGLPLPPLSPALTTRQVLAIVVERFRLIGSEVFLEDARPVPITFWLSVRAKEGYFRSELIDSITEVLSSDAGGLFETGRLGFGEDVFASNIVEAVMAVDGVETVCLNRFKRMGEGAADQADSGVIAIADDEIAICQNIPGRPELGFFQITVNGGETG